MIGNYALLFGLPLYEMSLRRAEMKNDRKAQTICKTSDELSAIWSDTRDSGAEILGQSQIIDLTKYRDS